MHRTDGSGSFLAPVGLFRNYADFGCVGDEKTILPGSPYTFTGDRLHENQSVSSRFLDLKPPAQDHNMVGVALGPFCPRRNLHKL